MLVNFTVTQYRVILRGWEIDIVQNKETGRKNLPAL